MTDITQPIRDALAVLKAAPGVGRTSEWQALRTACEPHILDQVLARLDVAEANVRKANSQAEEFERKWHLQSEELETLQTRLDAETKAFQETCVISSIRGAQLDAAEKDAARYRWLRGQELHDPVIYIGVDGIDFKNRWALGAGDETKTDAAIDEFMKGKP